MSILPLSDYKGEPLYKIVFIADHESDLAEAKQLYADQFVFCESKLDSLTDGFVNGELINRNLIRAPESRPSVIIWAARWRIPSALVTAIMTCR